MLPLVVNRASYGVNGKAIIEDVSFAIHDVGLTALLGPNGAGKSSLLKLCHGLLPLSSGSIRWGEADVREVQQKQAMVFQRPVLLRRSAAENVDYVLKLRGASSADRARVIQESLDWAGLRRHRSHASAQVVGWRTAEPDHRARLGIESRGLAVGRTHCKPRSRRDPAGRGPDPFVCAGRQESHHGDTQHCAGAALSR